MNLKIGIVGMPNVGKSTLFNAIVKKQLARVAEYPFTTIEPHESIIEIPDERLTTLALMVKPEKVTPATITFIDIAGLVKNAHKGEGLGNEFLGHIREVDALLQVVRTFENPNAAHILITIDPERDIEIINTELLLKDLEIIGKIINDEKNLNSKQTLLKVKTTLNSGIPIAKIQLPHEEKQQIDNFHFLTAKPTFYVINISERELNSPRIKELKDKDIIVTCAKLEADLIELSPLEQQEYLKSLGIRNTSLDQVVKKAYEILNMTTFFTIKGGNEVRACTIKRGTSALAASGIIHTDFEKHFIKAEVIHFKTFIQQDGWLDAHKKGKIETVGRDYVIQDGDIIEFKKGN